MQKRRSKTRQLIGFVPHETDLDPWLTIEQNIRFSSLLYRVRDNDYKNRLHLYANKLAITEFMSEIASKVSYGIQKRAMLVRALMHNPEILILDEFTSFLDKENEVEIAKEIREFRGKKTILMIIHKIYIFITILQKKIAHY